jgi:O-acetylserine/cysteine efflux transporter
MPLRDFSLLIAVCLLWALANVINKLVVDQIGAPPLLYAALRFALVMLITLPWLPPLPRPLWRMAAVSLLLGGASFALMFFAFQTASPSTAAIVMQLGVPMTTLLSVIMLGERVRWRRGLGIALTLAGALLVIWTPEGLQLSIGVLLILASTFANSLGAVMMKQMEGIRPMRFQAWVSFFSFWPLIALSAAFEHQHWGGIWTLGWPFWLAVVFSALVVSLGAHTGYYFLIQRYEANLIATLTLLTPLATIALGVLITHDHFDLRMGIGAAVALTGVLIVALRPNRASPQALVMRNRGQ